MKNGPEWWDWEFILSDHVLDRMPERDFDEVDVRTMIDEAFGWKYDYVPGRFIVQTRLRGSDWEVVVEPEEPEQVVVVVTAYRVDQP